MHSLLDTMAIPHLPPNCPFAGDMCRANGALLLVDTVCSLGGVPMYADAWGVDAIYSGSQKCLSAPPGASPVMMNERALAKIKRRKTKVRG
jgi:alanine-glyoxylate transaminase/serine-glyoxylate transaminase/serine-pyruvate transaminase